MKLPTYQNSIDAVLKNTGATALQVFIANNEPAGQKAEREFRTELQSALSAAHAAGFAEAREMAVQTIDGIQWIHGEEVESVDAAVASIRALQPKEER